MQKLSFGKTSHHFSLHDAVVMARRLFTSVGIDTALLDAQLLLAHVLKTDRLSIQLSAKRILLDEECAAFFALVKRRLTHEPIAYITGHKEFYGLDLIVTPAVLIPRPDTEIIVEKCLEFIRDHDVIFDLCTGSGAIALAIAHARPHVRVLASDISAEALNIASMNRDRLQLTQRLTLLLGDLFAPFGDERASLIVSNPPYIETATVPTLQSSVRHFEPHQALDGGDDGLDFYRRLINEAPRFLVDNGYLILEFGCTQAQQVAALSAPFFATVEIVKDLAGLDRGIVLQKR